MDPFDLEFRVFGRGNRKPPLNRIETIIGPNSTFDGKLVCDGSVRIDGVCKGGVIETVGNIVVSPQAKVAADLIAENVSVGGAVTGNIQARSRLEILSTGRVWGDVDVGSFLLDEDAYFRGKLSMKDAPAPPPQIAKQPLAAEPDVSSRARPASAVDNAGGGATSST